MEPFPAGDRFAEAEYRDLVIYQELARTETVPEFRRILEQLVEHERGDYDFWRQYASKTQHTVHPLTLPLVRLLRKVLGLTFTAKLIERNEKRAVRDYAAFLKEADPSLKTKIQEILEHEERHEQEMIGQIKEEKIAFISSIVLGLNDALIELSGALVGFSFAFRNPRLAAATGLIAGIAASLSMASSAYMQARHEPGKDPRKAAMYTGGSYLAVVVLLIAPFFLFGGMVQALGLMFALIVLIIAGMSCYTSVIFDRRLASQFAAMCLASLGVAAVTFLIGNAINRLLPPSYAHPSPR